MATKSVYQDFDNDALKYFGLETDPLYGLVSSSMGIDKVLISQDETTYNKIHSILTVPTEDGQTFRTKKKAFILPKCNVSQDRMKAALKEHGITVTNDYELADLIIGHDDISTYKLNNAEKIPSTIMMNKLWNYETTLGDSDDTGVLKAIGDSGVECIVTPQITDRVRYYDVDMNDNLLDVWMLTGMAVNLAHIIDTTDVSVIDTETVLHASATKLVLDEQLLSDLKTQLNSYNDDKALAIKIVPNIDYTKNYHLLWQLAQDCNNLEYADNRDKDLQYWLKESNFTTFYRKSAQDMILWLEDRDLLCKTTFRYLEPIVRSEISIQNRDLYTFRVAVKKEYQQYLK